MLERINNPEDLKRLNISELSALADEVRAVLIEKLSHTGGHVGSNLGVVELTVALHYVFSSAYDKIVWDVSHQSYAHKILTGRKDAFTDPQKYRSVTGFTNIHESPHDLFTIGHTSTSISLALGLAKARDAMGGKENVVAIIGDGALGGGEALEGLNYLGEYRNNLILILNDNDQSVAENHGGLYQHLRELRETGGNSERNLFKCLGLAYHYLENGHDTRQLVELLSNVKDSSHPVVIHVHTIKGKGLAYAEKDRESWHSGAPFRIESGEPKNGYPVYDTTVFDSLADLLNRDPHSVVLTAGTPRALGFVEPERSKYAQTGRFVDVGIAEQNAMGMSSGVARYGGNAVFGVYSPFLQRAYDQLSHDICLNHNAATLLVLLPGAYGMKSNTHLGICDIQLLSHVPGLVYLCPAYKEEYLQMFAYATAQNRHPTAIRVPCRFYERGSEDTTDYSIHNKARVVRQGRGCALIAVGTLIPKALEAAEACKKATGEEITVIDPVFLSGLDVSLLDSLKEDHRLVVTWEDGELWGGYGQQIASFYGDSDMKVWNFGLSKEFHTDFNADELLAQNGISSESLIHMIQKYL